MTDVRQSWMYQRLLLQSMMDKLGVTPEQLTAPAKVKKNKGVLFDY